jgi:hypothetical protein
MWFNMAKGLEALVSSGQNYILLGPKAGADRDWVDL